MTFGQRIKVFRQRVSKSQKDIEAETEIPQATLSGWENDKSEPCVSDAVKLAAALGVTVAELIDGPDQQPGTLPRTG